MHCVVSFWLPDSECLYLSHSYCVLDSRRQSAAISLSLFTHILEDCLFMEMSRVLISMALSTQTVACCWTFTAVSLNFSIMDVHSMQYWDETKSHCNCDMLLLCLNSFFSKALHSKIDRLHSFKTIFHTFDTRLTNVGESNFTAVVSYTLMLLIQVVPELRDHKFVYLIL